MYDVRSIIPTDSKCFIDLFRMFIHSCHYYYRIEKTYCHWVLCFIRFNQLNHPREMGNAEKK